MGAEVKKPTTYTEQIEKLQARGCFISDVNFCKEVLSDINYYRLSAYFLPFKDEEGNYKDGTSFHDVYRLYEFDRKLRGMLFTVIEEVEVYWRTKLAYYHAHKYGATGYLEPTAFSQKHDHSKFERNLSREISNNKKSLFVMHHLNHYDGVFPLWVATELFTFGMLSCFYSDLKPSDQAVLAEECYSTSRKNVASWLRCCTDLRNICAHYGRLYYRIFPAIPAGLDLPESKARRLWGQILALKNLYPYREKWNREIQPTLNALFEEYHGTINLYHIAFPEDWSAQLKK